MLALAEAFSKAQKKDTKSSTKMAEWEAKALGITIETYNKWKKGFEETYAVVDETFEKGYKMPNTTHRKYSLKGLRY